MHTGWENAMEFQATSCCLIEIYSLPKNGLNTEVSDIRTNIVRVPFTFRLLLPYPYLCPFPARLTPSGSSDEDADLTHTH